MLWYWALTLLLGAACVLMFLGIPVALAFLTVNLAGAALFLGGVPGATTALRGLVPAIANFGLAPIPLFILMGEILFHTGMAFSAVAAIDRLIQRVPGRLSIVSVVGGTIFAALSGSTIANTAMLGSALLPEMEKRGYKPAMSAGPIMAVGGIAMLIPPSALAVLLASIALIPVAPLLVGGIIPALIMSAVFIGYLVVRAIMDPASAPSYPVEAMTLRERLVPLLRDVVPLSVIFIAVLGSIFAGIASPTDSAALGAVASVAIAAMYGKLSRKALMTALTETGKLSVVILFIVAASSVFSQILAFSGAADGALQALLGFDLTPLQAVLIMLLIYLILGCFIDQVSMMLITLPFFMPLAHALHIDVIWLGVLFLITIEMGLLTPPFGLLLFVMKGVAPHIPLTQIYRAAIPFVLMELAVVALIVAVPALALWLPGLL